MTWHIHGTVLTPSGIAANNRGENSGNLSTLQKVIWKGEVYTTVSGEAIRHAIRQYWTGNGEKMNRAIDYDGTSKFADPKFKKWQDNVDDDVMGFMLPDKETIKRRGRFSVSRCLSLRPWPGDIVFGAASPGATPDEDKNPKLYSTEVHATRYQYTFTIVPEGLHDNTRAEKLLSAIFQLANVAGNHSRFLYDFSPDAVVLRITPDPSPKISLCFAESEQGEIDVSELLYKIDAGTFTDPSEIVMAGHPLRHLKNGTEKGKHEKGFRYYPGVGKAFEVMSRRLAKVLA